MGTPIGNLEDITARAVRTLSEAGTIYCEDTRRTRKLLSALGVGAPRLVRLDRHNEAAMVARVVAAVGGGERAVVVSDAGMPAICDPGSVLVEGVADAGLPVEVVPGPCAVSAALAVSGLPASQYRFVGFPPRKGTDRRAVLGSIATSTVTVVLYEAAPRVARTVADLATACGPGRHVVAARELTKLHEEVWRGTLGDAVRRFGDGEAEPRGEFVLLVAPAAAVERPPPSEEEVARAVRARMAGGMDRRRAVSEVAAELAVPRRRVYDVAVSLK